MVRSTGVAGFHSPQNGNLSEQKTGRRFSYMLYFNLLRFFRKHINSVKNRSSFISPRF